MELGDRVKDHVTGFVGIATARCEYLHGHTRWLVEAIDQQTGKTIEDWFDEARLGAA